MHNSHFTNPNIFPKQNIDLKNKTISSNKAILDNLQIFEISNIREAKDCRICFQSAQTLHNQLISPCKCNGSLQYVHENCYQQWINHQFKSKNQLQQQNIKAEGLECQLCLHKVQLYSKNEYECYNYIFFHQKYRQNRPIFYLFTIFLAIDIGNILFLIFYATQNSIDFRNQLIASVAIVCAFFFLALTGIIVSCYLINQFLLKTTQSISIKPKERQQSNNLSIVPVADSTMNSIAL